VTFGEALRRLRKDKRLSQSGLSALTDIPQTTISDLENDKYYADISQARKLASALDVSVSDFLEGNDGQGPTSTCV
jgi:transcriptional regulator with XRE-family HTH domain